MPDANRIIAAAHDLLAAQQAAHDATAEAAALADAHATAVERAREAREIADLAARVSMVVDETPIELSSTGLGATRTYRVVNLTDERRWSTHVPWHGGWRVWLRRFGDYGNADPIDVPEEEAAVAMGIDWVLCRR
jgi:hypothetical protein